VGSSLTRCLCAQITSAYPTGVGASSPFALHPGSHLWCFWEGLAGSGCQWASWLGRLSAMDPWGWTNRLL